MNEAELDAGLAPTPKYRYADVVGDRLYVAGQVPLDASGDLVGEGDVTAQARQCLDNLLTVVRVHGFDPDDIHHLTVHVVGPHQHLLDAWDAIVGGFAGTVPPATLLGCSCLGYGRQLVELDAHVERAAVA